VYRGEGTEKTQTAKASRGLRKTQDKGSGALFLVGVWTPPVFVDTLSCQFGGEVPIARPREDIPQARVLPLPVLETLWAGLHPVVWKRCLVGPAGGAATQMHCPSRALGSTTRREAGNLSTPGAYLRTYIIKERYQ